MRLLVTGGAGFIGCNFVRYLLQTRKEVTIVNLDKLTYAGNTENLADIADDSRYRFVHGDIADKDLVAQIFENGIDGVVNLAAETHVDRSILDSTPFLHSNVLGTQCLLDAAYRHRVRRFIQISSDEVYGNVPTGECRDENAALSPSSPYAASKAAADHLVCAYSKTYGFSSVILRSTNNYGPYQFPEKFIPLMIANTLDEKVLPLYGDGHHERDWIYVQDFCRAIAAALDIPQMHGIYNVATHKRATNLQVARKILELLGKPASLISQVEDRPGHDQRYAVDSSNFRREADWAPEVCFEDGLRKTVDWYQKNSVWLARARSGEYQAYYERHYVRREETFSSERVESRN